MCFVLIAALLLSGCGAPSLLSPGATARQAVLTNTRTVALAQKYPASQADCMARTLDAALSDVEMQRADAAIAASTPDPTFMRAVVSAASSCQR